MPSAIRRWAALFVAGLAMISACSSLKGRPLKQAPAECTTNWLRHQQCEEPSGVPYALSRPRFGIQRKTLTGGKKARPVYEVIVNYEADSARRFEVGMSKGLLTNDTFELTLDPTGRALAMNSARADRTGQTIAGLVTAGAAAAGVAARAFASELEGPAVASRVCIWIDAQLSSLAAERETIAVDLGAIKRDDFSKAHLEKQLDDTITRIRNASAGSDLDVSALRTQGRKALAAELNRRSTDLKNQIDEFQCSTAQKCIGASDPVKCPPPTLCTSTDKPCQQALTDVARKARKLLANKVCDRNRYVERDEPVKPDPEVAEIWTDIVAIEKSAAAADQIRHDPGPADALTKQLLRLRNDADAAVAAAALAAAAQSPDLPQKKLAMEKAIDALKAVVDIVLTADERLHTRRLERRRDLLLRFVATTAPTGEGQAETYAKYRTELDAVQQALAEIIPKPGDPPTALSDAIEVTSTIDKEVLTERYGSPLTDEALRDRIVFAHVQIGLGCIQAVVIASPEATGSAGDRR